MSRSDFKVRSEAAAPPKHPLSGGQPPDWASGWGHDQYGPFADLVIGRVKQRFRWCPPGEFWMGSPEGEVGRHSDEGPRHLVKLTHGFWMADTPVTQALYIAVMGVNPSKFADPEHLDRPVESVSWEDAKGFCAKVDAFPSLGSGATVGASFRLPTEAEWEYACRAGSKGARYLDTLRGDIRLDEILEVRKFSEESEGGPPSVKQRIANSWGLFDTLGVVLEWCLDEVEKGASYPDETLEDPVQVGGSLRPGRGGAWDQPIAMARAASRVADFVDWSWDRNGFRLCIGPPPRGIPAVRPKDG